VLGAPTGRRTRVHRHTAPDVSDEGAGIDDFPADHPANAASALAVCGLERLSVLVLRSIVLFGLAAYGGVFVAGSLAWGMVADGYRPDRFDVTGALICLAGVAVIMYAPRS
jgi:drug/metabolite transporter superfamily protein YnfA